MRQLSAHRLATMVAACAASAHIAFLRERDPHTTIAYRLARDERYWWSGMGHAFTVLAMDCATSPRGRATAKRLCDNATENGTALVEASLDSGTIPEALENLVKLATRIKVAPSL